MKKRPGKFKITGSGPKTQKRVSWNSCHDAHTEWLPDEDEILRIIKLVKEDCAQPISSGSGTIGMTFRKNYNVDEAIAKAIRKRLE